MVNSKLLVFFKSLSIADIKALGVYLNASKQTTDVVLLYNYLKKYSPSFPEKNFAKEMVAKKIFSKDKNKIKKLQNAMARLGQLLDDFLINDQLKCSQTYRDFLYLEALKKRQLNKFFFKKADQMEKVWQKKQPVGLEHLYNEYKLKEICYSHPGYSLLKKMPISLQTLIEYIDKHYIATKLYWTSGVFHNNYYLSNPNALNNKQHLVDELQAVYVEKEFYNVPQIRIFGQLLEAFKINNFDNYLAIKNDFLDNFGLFSEREKNDTLTALHSVCYENYKIGNSDTLKHLFDLNCIMLENDFLLENGYLSTAKFWNILNIGLASKEFTWLKKFIQNNYVFLNDDEQQDVLTISKSKLYLYEGKFGKAIENMSTVKFKNILYGLQSRNILLQCYFELGEDYTDLFLDLAKSFYMFLNRKEIFANTTRLAFNNFITFSKSLYKVKNEPDSQNLTILKTKLNNYKNIANKRWLIDKLQEIEVSIKQMEVNY